MEHLQMIWEVVKKCWAVWGLALGSLALKDVQELLSVIALVLSIVYTVLQIRKALRKEKDHAE